MKYASLHIRLRELDDEILEEINPLDISVEQDGKGNAPCLSKVLRCNYCLMRGESST